MVQKVTVYHASGNSAIMSSIDAQQAIQTHPGEYAFSAFDEKYVKKFNAKAEKESEKAEPDKVADETVSNQDGTINALNVKISQLTGELTAMENRAIKAEAHAADLEARLSGIFSQPVVEPVLTDELLEKLSDIELPEGVLDLKFPQKKKLAATIVEIAGGSAEDNEEVDAVLIAELARRREAEEAVNKD